MNPRKRRRRTYRRRHHPRRRHYRRNPGFGGGIMGDLKSITPAVGWGLAGYVGMSVIPGFAGKFLPVPDKASNPAGYYGIKLLTAVGLGFLAGRMIGRQAGRHILAGSVLTVAAEATNQFALAPAGLATYLPDTMSGEEDEIETYLPEAGAMGYLSPGATVDDFSNEAGVTRLDPNRRL